MHLKKAIIDHDRFPGADVYPFNLPVLKGTDAIEFPTPVTIFTGENGTGKSTLLSALCRRCNVYIWEGGSRQRVEKNPYEKMLDRALDVEWAHGLVPGSYFSPELFRHFSQLVDEWASASPELLEYFGGKSFVSQSHGQSCMAYFKSRFKVKGIHFLDEPEAALSPATQLALLEVLSEMSGEGHAQFVISTHSPILMSCPRATVYSFDNDAITPVSFMETEHYRIYKEFFQEQLPPPAAGDGRGAAMKDETNCMPDSGVLIELARMRMPFGKYQGRLLIDLPEPYVVWLSNKGFPKGPLGEMLGMLYEIKVNGLEYLFKPLRQKS